MRHIKTPAVFERGLVPELGPDTLANRKGQVFFRYRVVVELRKKIARRMNNKKIDRRMNNKAWDDFVHWCQANSLNAVPANSWTIAAYVRWCEPRMKPSVIAKTIMEINRVHESKTRKRINRDPLVKRTLKMIETRSEKARDSVKLDLFDDSLTTSSRSPKKIKSLSNKSSQKRLPHSASVSRLKRGLNSSPRLVSRRKLVR